MRQKVEFNSGGLVLSGALETPTGTPRAYALFAHCFTCGKDVAAASRIARTLTQQGIAVLRFDFTGLGNSDGDFGNTNFSSNMQDLLAAVAFLREYHKAPSLLIGHSLGGAAVLAMAAQVPEVTAVATIGAPHSAAHVMHNFSGSVEAIRETGEAQVQLGQREFTIKRQFINDLEQFETGYIGKLRKALLVMHAPLDATVNIEEAEKIYLEARHPKSFVSLDQADHLLSQRADSAYVATVIAGWASRYLPQAASKERVSVPAGEILVEEKDHKFSHDIYSDNHHWLADEPKSVGGADSGADPYEHLLAGLGACTSMTLRMYATRKQWPLEHVNVALKHNRDHLSDCENCEEPNRKIELIERTVTLEGNLDEQQRERLLEIADRCPVHRTLHGELEVKTTLAAQRKSARAMPAH